MNRFVQRIIPASLLIAATGLIDSYARADFVLETYEFQNQPGDA